jgi:outer membrane protein assembly factor BamE (lipoprotein component of BamABCDE complex)
MTWCFNGEPVMKIFSTLCSAILSAVLLTSCVTTGRNFPSDVDWVVKNTTSEEDVELMLGAPSAVGSSSGVKTWTYGYYHYSVWNNASYKELKIYWNPNRTVQSFTFTSSFPQDTSSKAKKQVKKP